MSLNLKDYQLEAINNLKNGSILCGGVGSGKSRTSLGYYYLKVCEGDLRINVYNKDVLLKTVGNNRPMSKPRDLYIITTAKKRDDHEWETEFGPFMLSENNVNVTIDSWNNIQKYKKVYGAFFIFDEQRVVGYGAWSKTFLNIARKNQWILASATPGDQWSDYIPVFIANGFYKNKTEFTTRHVVYSRFTKYPKIDKYIDIKTLIGYRDSILVTMKDERQTVRHNIKVPVEYDKELYRRVYRDRWNVYDNEPIEESGKLCYLMRKVINDDESRMEETKKIMLDKKRVIIFYNFTYELEKLRKLAEELNYEVGEWNGQTHTEVPDGERWVYLVQYTAGCEGWNCITTDTIEFFSQSYSYRQTEQAAGRIDRMNTPFKDLYYYRLRSTAPIDLAIHRALSNKRNFNQSAFLSKN